MTEADPGADTDMVTRLSPTWRGASTVMLETTGESTWKVSTVNAGAAKTAESVKPDLHAMALYTTSTAGWVSSIAVPVYAVDPAAHAPELVHSGFAPPFR